MGARTSVRWVLALALVVLVAGTTVAPAVDAAATKTFTTSALATGSPLQWRAETEGDLIVYESMSLAPGSFSDVIVRNLTTGTDTTIWGGDLAAQRKPDVSQGRVVYEDATSGDDDVRVWDSWLGTDYSIASSTDDESSPRISGNLVVWANTTTSEIWYRDLARGNTAKLPDDTSDFEYFDVDRGRIFWTKDQFRDSVWVFEPGISTVSRQIYSPLSTRSIDSLTAYGDWVAITMDIGSTPEAYRRSTEQAVGDSMGNNTSRPALFGDAMTYADGIPSSETDLSWFRRSITTTATAIDDGTVAGTSLSEGYPSMYGNRVAYEHLAAIMNIDVYVGTSANEVSRTEGSTRYDTAVEASKAYFHASDNAVLCTGMNFPDALAAGPLARLLGGPLLLTRTTTVPANVMDELARLEVETVFVIGGTGVVSADVVDELETAGYTVERIAGDDRYATSVEIAKYMDVQLSGAYTLGMAFFARGDNFPDALAVGPVAAGALSPIILTRSTEVPATVADVVDILDITSGVIVGGDDVVSNDVRDDLIAIMQANGAGPNPMERWSGPTRYDTAIEIVKNGVAARWIDLDTVGVATGRNFPDALGGGAALGHYGSAILLVRDTVPDSVNTWVKDNKFAIGEMDIFGGSDVVPDSVKSTLTSLIN